jgi:hypothetical protein
VETAQGIDFYPFDLAGQISEPKLMELEFHPNELVLNDGILSATGWASNQQVWWMLDSGTIDNEEPAVVQIPNRFYVNFDQTFFDKDRSLAWVPVGAYGVETVDIASLFREPAEAKRSRSVRSKANNRTWVRYQLESNNLTSAGEDDVLGPLTSDEIWRYQPVEPLTYHGWMARRLGEENNPDFVPPPASGDLDGDGRSNWNEFAFGTNPMEADTERMRIQGAAGDETEIEFDLPRGHQGVEWEAQVSRNLTDWETLSVDAVSAKVVGVSTTRVVLRFSRSAHGDGSFFRLNFKR